MTSLILRASLLDIAEKSASSLKASDIPIDFSAPDSRNCDRSLNRGRCTSTR